jgi:DNA-binding Lrp family transcriptional regulator
MNHKASFEKNSKARCGVLPSSMRDCSTYQVRYATLSELEFHNNLILFFRQDKIYFMEKLNEEEKKVARFIQDDIPLTSSPFAEIGKSCGLTAAGLVNISQSFLKKRIMRKFGAILRHQKAGYKKNALVVWSVPAAQVAEAGEIFASFIFVSHCYERNPAFKKKYNLFTMIHLKDNNISSRINDMATAACINDYLILESIQEYKKISPEYF